MAAMTETQVAAAELEKIDAVLPELFEVEDTFYSQIEKKNVQVVSYREMRVPMKIWPGGKPGHFDSSSSNTTAGLGRGSGPKWAYAAVTPVTTRHAIEWDLKSEWATDDRRKAVVNAVREAVAEAMAEYRRWLDSLAMTAGNAILATVSSVATNTPTGYNRYTCDSEYGVRLLRYNHNVVFCTTAFAARTAYDGSAYSATNTAEIVNIDYASKTFDITYHSNINAAATDYVLPEGLALGSAPTSFYGVGYHASSASTGTWLGMDRATYPQIRANSVNAAGALSLTHARLAMNKVGERLGQNKMKKMVAWMHPCQVQAYEEMGQLVQVINRTGGSQQGLDMYFDVQQIAGAPIRKHFSWSKKRIDFMDMSLWGRAEIAPVQWFKTEGRRIHNIYTSGGVVTPIFGSYLVSSFQYFHENPATMSYIYGLTIPSGY